MVPPQHSDPPPLLGEGGQSTLGTLDLWEALSGGAWGAECCGHVLNPTLLEAPTTTPKQPY